MPNLIPGFLWQPLPINYSKRARRQKGRGLVGHVAVSESSNLRPWDENDWHAYLPREGPGIQYIDLDYVAYTSLDGSYSMASFESQGGMGSSAQLNAEPWSDNQIRLAATFLRHLHDTEGVPLQVMPDSRPSSRGFGTHRLGIDPWRVAGGERWTRWAGKECPGNRKHEQRFDIVRLAASGDLEDDMPDEATFKKWVREAVVTAPIPKSVGGVGPSDLDSYLNGIADRAASASRLSAQAVALAQQSSGAKVDVKALAEALVPLLSPVLQTKFGASKQDVEDALREVLGGLDSAA